MAKASSGFAVVLMSLASIDGRIFYQLGSRKTSEPMTKIKCQLPGTKRARGELPQKALDRLLDQDLHLLAPGIEVSETDHEVDRTDSPQYGMPTTYMKTVHHALISSSFDFTILPIASVENLPSIPSLSAHGLPHDVYALPDGKQNTLFLSWLSPQQFDFLKSDAGEVALKQWLDHLEIRSISEASV